MFNSYLTNGIIKTDKQHFVFLQLNGHMHKNSQNPNLKKMHISKTKKEIIFLNYLLYHRAKYYQSWGFLVSGEHERIVSSERK